MSHVNQQRYSQCRRERSEVRVSVVRKAVWSAARFQADARTGRVLAEWKFERGGWLQVYQLPERAGNGSVTLAVNGLDQQISALRRTGMDVGEPMRNTKANVVMIKDPDGNSIALAEALDPAMAK